MQQSRRSFMRLAGAGLVMPLGLQAVAAPSERVRHAVIGTGNQGRQHARAFDAASDCDVVALCDLDPRRRAKVRGGMAKPDAVMETDDFHTILEDDSIDSVSVATPDHWHTSIALHALQAGKHVYVEKPCSHNIAEGLTLEQAAKKSGKCVQHGTHSRGSAGIRDGIAYLQEGHLGKVRLAKAINHQLRKPIGRAPVSEPPAGVDYDRWLGPAPVHPFTKNRWHYNWHWFWDYGCGDIGNDGIHQIDQARWGLNVEYPKSITGSGGQLFYDDDHETPDTQLITYEYDDCYLVYEMRLWTSYPLEGHDNGVVFYGDAGKLEIGRQGCHVTLKGEEKQKVGDGAAFDSNVRNFLDAVKADDPAMLQAPIDEGVISSSMCHMGNIVSRIGRSLRYDASTGLFDADEANALRTRSYREGYELPAL